MAEIKSTMEMVMERAARMGETDSSSVDSEEMQQDGMRAAAGFMEAKVEDLAQVLGACNDAERPAVQQGMVRVLLRNIMLPREEEQQEVAEKAMHGLLQVGGGRQDLLAMFADMKKIIEQYLQHREQLKKQLEDNFASQMGQMEQNMAQQTGMQMKLQPAQHPKFQEEWQRITTELNGQYGNAIDQHKKLLAQNLG